MSTDKKIRFCCSNCNRVVTVSVEHAGKKGKCPGCHEVVEIPRSQLEVQIRELQNQIANSHTEATRLQKQIEILAEERAKLASEYAHGRDRVIQMRSELASLEENLEDVSYGLYKPHFTFESSAKYKAAINDVTKRQKQMVKDGEAATCSTTWTVGDSQQEGKKMIKQYLKLLLRAFNGEADAAICKVTWSNYRVMETRIRKAYDALNKLGTVMHMSISPKYVDLKLDELRLTFEEEEKKQQEKEEQRRLKAQMKEEEKVQRELARVKEEAEEQEATYERALVEAREEAAKAVDSERDVFNQRIAELERELAAAHAKRERAIAQAQLTKMGKVYIISNIGSFGDGVFKIGMTRRVEHEDRIRELGDASVPFPFDVHAWIDSDDCPALECAIQTHFWERRVNRANDRKEFFRVSLDELEAFARNQGFNVEFSKLAAAKEYRQTLADLQRPVAREESDSQPVACEEYPENLFA
jgi:predicted  nucleic acid-binding Zn-ribbon protein